MLGFANRKSSSELSARRTATGLVGAGCGDNGRGMNYSLVSHQTMAWPEITKAQVEQRVVEASNAWNRLPLRARMGLVLTGLFGFTSTVLMVVFHRWGFQARPRLMLTARPILAYLDSTALKIR